MVVVKAILGRSEKREAFIKLVSRIFYAMHECFAQFQWSVAFGPGDPGSNPGWFAVSNSN